MESVVEHGIRGLELERERAAALLLSLDARPTMVQGRDEVPDARLTIEETEDAGALGRAARLHAAARPRR
jgi:hypothetical protein